MTTEDKIKELERQNKALIIEVIATLNGEGIFYSDEDNIDELYRIPQIREVCVPREGI